jgi:hypothetical protein
MEMLPKLQTTKEVWRRPALHRFLPVHSFLSDHLIPSAPGIVSSPLSISNPILIHIGVKLGMNYSMILFLLLLQFKLAPLSNTTYLV